MLYKKKSCNIIIIKRKKIRLGDRVQRPPPIKDDICVIFGTKEGVYYQAK